MAFQQRSAFAKYVGPQKKPVIDTALLAELSENAVRENQACARKVALAAQIWDSCIHQTIQIGDLITDAGNYAASETAKALGCSKTVADTFAEIGMDLRLRLPAIKAAFEAGELDLARVRAIYRVTGSVSLGAAGRIEAEVLAAARRLSPGPLATEIAAIIQRTAPDEVADAREDLKKLTGVRYRDKDLIATIEANLEAADAAACWQSISEMAATLCPRDPRTRSQRLAAAYIACMQREQYLACTCEVDEDHPCTAKRELPDRRVPLTSITIDLATLAGLSDLPAFLAGHGLIDAAYARELAANSDWQIVITEARNIADELGITPDHDTPAAAPDDSAGNDESGKDESGDDAESETEGDGAGSRGEGEGSKGQGADREGDGPVTTGHPSTGNHMTFHPLGRGRRRRGLGVPKLAAAETLSTQASSEVQSKAEGQSEGGTYRGSYSLIAALENAIAANPAVAAALYPNGQGGFIEPPAGALQYKPRTAVADLVRHRDRTCRFPGCDVPAASCEIDHIVPYRHHDPARGGWTILTNLHCLCRYHHSLKTMGAWHPTMLAGAIEYWQSNSGTTAVTLPGNTIGTTDLTGHTLTPHIPRKRRPKHTTETADQKPTDQKPADQKTTDENNTDEKPTDTAQTDTEQKDNETKTADTASTTTTTTATTTKPRPTPTTCWSMKLSPGERADADDPAPY